MHISTSLFTVNERSHSLTEPTLHCVCILTSAGRQSAPPRTDPALRLHSHFCWPRVPPRTDPVLRLHSHFCWPAECPPPRTDPALRLHSHFCWPAECPPPELTLYCTLLSRLPSSGGSPVLEIEDGLLQLRLAGRRDELTARHHLPRQLRHVRLGAERC